MENKWPWRESNPSLPHELPGQLQANAFERVFETHVFKRDVYFQAYFLSREPSFVETSFCPTLRAVEEVENI